MQPNDKAPAVSAVDYISYAATGFFPGIVLDYLSRHERLSPFYEHPPTTAGIRQAITERQQHPVDRQALVAVLKEQYKTVVTTQKISENIDLLLHENTFTVTTAHQPNIFTGPLYFIYKIVHAIKLAEQLRGEFPTHHFVPVFYMGSEDADIAELGHFTVNGKKYEWKTKQTGAVGRMKVDKAFLSLIAGLEGQLGVLPYGEEVIAMFRAAYREGKTLQQSTFELVNALFGSYGLVVLLPDDAALKRMFIPVIQKELDEQFSHRALEETVNRLGSHYKVQAGGRELNLFYLRDDKRERIEIEKNAFVVRNLGLSFTREEIMAELHEHPERFSPNVILRGLFQEMILPNIVFIGGGGEIAYWLELKKIFETAGVPYPVLVLRNSFLLMTDAQATQLNEMGFEIKDVFISNDRLLNKLALRESSGRLSLSEEKGELNSFYRQLHETAGAIDPTLAEHVNALQAKALKRIAELEKKMLRTEKKKFEAEKRRIAKIRAVLFPNESLQERVENFSGFYAKQGKAFIENIHAHSPALEQQFTILIL